MRRIPALFAVTAVAAAGLVGCSTPSGGASCTRPAFSSTAAELVDVSGALGSAPRVSVRTPFHADVPSAADVVSGEGTRITDPNQLVYLDISVFAGDSGEEVIATAYDGDPAAARPLSQFSQAFPGLESALECAAGGSRVVVALPPDGIDPAAAEQFGLGDQESAVAVVDLHKVYLARADGADQYIEGHGLPTVVRAPDGRPGIIVPETEAPDELVVEVLKRGDGAAVGEGTRAWLHFTTVGWEKGTVLNSTWGEAPIPVTPAELPESLASALDGQTVGSQILVVVPAGEQEASQTVIYVIDILGVDES